MRNDSPEYTSPAPRAAAVEGARERPSVLRAGLVLGIGQASVRLAVAAYSLVLVHRLTPTAYGTFATAVAVLGILLALSDGGFSRLLFRDVARSGTGTGLVEQLLVLRSAWVGIVLTVTAAAAWADLIPYRGAFLLALLIGLGADAAAAGFEAASIGAERPARVVVGQILASVFLGSALAALLVVEATETLALMGLAGAAGTRLAWQLRAWRLELILTRVRLTGAKVVSWGRAALPYLLLGTFGTLYYRMDMVILTARRGAAETAPYAAVYRLVDAALVVGAVAAAAITPRMSRLHENNPEAVWAAWRRYAFLTAVTSIPAAAALAVFANPLTRTLFGAQYSDAASDALRLLAPGIVLMLLQVVNAVVLFTSDEERLVALLVALLVLWAVPLNLALTWWLTGRLGSEGAALATSVSEAFTFVFCALIVRRGLRNRRPRAAVA